MNTVQMCANIPPPEHENEAVTIVVTVHVYTGRNGEANMATSVYNPSAIERIHSGCNCRY